MQGSGLAAKLVVKVFENKELSDDSSLSDEVKTWADLNFVTSQSLQFLILPSSLIAR